MSFTEWLDGNKTYCVVALALAAGVLHRFGIIDTELLKIVFGLLGIGAVAALRHAVSKAESPGEEKK